MIQKIGCGRKIAMGWNKKLNCPINFQCGISEENGKVMLCDYCKDDMRTSYMALQKTKKMIKCTGIASHSRLYLSGFQKHIKQKDIPQYFTIEIDINSIKPRKKGEQLK